MPYFAAFFKSATKVILAYRHHSSSKLWNTGELCNTDQSRGATYTEHPDTSHARPPGLRDVSLSAYGLYCIYQIIGSIYPRLQRHAPGRMELRWCVVVVLTSPMRRATCLCRERKNSVRRQWRSRASVPEMGMPSYIHYRRPERK